MKKGATCRQGDKAPVAVRKIHTDIETGFIRMEGTRCEDLFELGNEAGIVFLFVVPLTAENAGSALGEGVLPLANLAGVNLKSIGQFGYRLFTFERFHSYPGFE